MKHGDFIFFRCIFLLVVSFLNYSCTKSSESEKSSLSEIVNPVPEESSPSGGNATGATLEKPSRLIPLVDFDSESSSNKASRPSKVCGESGSIVDRITDCQEKNGVTAAFDASKGGNPQGGGVWNLITRTSSSREVWQDSRTTLIWSDTLGDFTENNNQGLFNWCLASGNTEEDSLGLECRTRTEDSYNNLGITLCAESSGLQIVSGIHDTTDEMSISAWADTGSSIADAKGNLSATSGSVSWRLPTLLDWQQADRNGLRKVLPHLENSFWSATVSSSDRRNAWSFNGSAGSISETLRSEPLAVICVGQR